jgi:hypothetical protein
VNLLNERTTQTAFTVGLKNTFQVLLELITEDTDTNDVWKRTKYTFTETYQKVFGQRRNKIKTGSQ